MADWTTIAASTFDTGKPVKGSTHEAINENIEAIAQGAAGAPKYGTGAILVYANVSGGVLTSSRVVNSVDGLGVSVAVSGGSFLRLTALQDWSSADSEFVTYNIKSGDNEYSAFSSLGGTGYIQFGVTTTGAININVVINYDRTGTLPT